MKTSGKPRAKAFTRIRTSPGPGCGTGFSPSFITASGSPCSTTCHARMCLSFTSGFLVRGVRPSLLTVEEVCVGVAVRIDGFGHRIVGLDEQIPIAVPGERLDAVSLLNIRFGAEGVL